MASEVKGACEICGTKEKNLVEIPLISVPATDMLSWLDEAVVMRNRGMVRQVYTTSTCGGADCNATAQRSGVPGRHYPEWAKKPKEKK